MKIVGIVNITTDSFSDGGKFIEPSTAIAHANELAKSADVLELSGVSSNPRSEIVPADLEIERIQSVWDKIDATVSIDATKPEVQKFALENGAAYINDIKGFPDPSMYETLAKAESKLVVMHCISDIDKAVREPKTTEEVFASIHSFFDERIPTLEKAGIARERIIIDPGMGFFLSSNPEPSFAVLADIANFKKRYGLPVMISVSRKSFLRDGLPADHPDVARKSLELEHAAAGHGVDYVRTHDPRALRDALASDSALPSDKKA